MSTSPPWLPAARRVYRFLAHPVASTPPIVRFALCVVSAYGLMLLAL